MLDREHRPFTDAQEAAFEQPLDDRLVKTRKGASGMAVKYLEGHTAIDQANRLFGRGNWAYRPLSLDKEIVVDAATGESLGVRYKALVELVVRGCLAPIVEIGCQSVSTWNLTECVLTLRKKDDRKRPIEDWEKSRAARIITDAYEVAEKGAVTDGLKRALRTFGDQFGNALYGDGRVLLEESPIIPTAAPSSENLETAPALPNAPVATPTPSQSQATEQQLNSLEKLRSCLKLPAEPHQDRQLSYEAAKMLIEQLTARYREQGKAQRSSPTSASASSQPQPQSQPQPTKPLATVTAASLPLQRALDDAKQRAFKLGVVKTDAEFEALVDSLGVVTITGGADIAKINGKITELERAAARRLPASA